MNKLEGLNPDFLGKIYPSPTFEVTKEHLLKYAHATNDTNPFYIDESREGGIIAPVLFPVRILHHPLWNALTDPELNCDLVMLLFGEQDMHFFSPMRPGDIIETQGEITKMEKKASGEIFDLRGTCRRDGEIVVEATSRFFIRSRQKIQKKGPSKPKPAQPTVPEILFSHSSTVREDQTYDYAKASADHNPIHTDHDYAKKAGLGGVILHGLCTMAFTSQAFVACAADGDPRRLKRLKVRFTRPVRPGDTVTTQAWEQERTDKLITYGYQAITQQGHSVITDGIAQVSP